MHVMYAVATKYLGRIYGTLQLKTVKLYSLVRLDRADRQAKEIIAKSPSNFTSFLSL